MHFYSICCYFFMIFKINYTIFLHRLFRHGIHELPAEIKKLHRPPYSQAIQFCHILQTFLLKIIIVHISFQIFPGKAGIPFYNSLAPL